MFGWTKNGTNINLSTIALVEDKDIIHNAIITKPYYLINIFFVHNPEISGKYHFIILLTFAIFFFQVS